MKRIILLTLLSVVMVSCGASKTVMQSKKIIKGNWELTNISYSESGTFNVTLLNDTSKECFEGSIWNFISNNNSGIYTINKSSSTCPIGERNFIFTIQEIDSATGLYDFLLKPTDVKGKSATGTGFRLQLTQLNQYSMQWEQSLKVDGNPFTITMNFSKITE